MLLNSKSLIWTSAGAQQYSPKSLYNRRCHNVGTLLQGTSGSSSNRIDSSTGDDDRNNSNKDSTDEQSKESNVIEEELEMLHQNLASIEALEERNKAQIDSFIDEEDQWNSLEDFERELLESKSDIEERMENMTEELMQMWLGAKSMEG